MNLTRLFVRGWLCAGLVASLYAIDPAAREVHQRLLVLDTHFDTAVHLAVPGWSVLERRSWERDFTQVDYPRLMEGGVDGGFWTLFVNQGPRTPEGHARARDTALLIALRIREMVARHPAQFALATRADDAARIAAEGRQVIYLSMENGYPLGLDLSLIQTFRQLGVRMMGVVHTSNNELADSATDVKGPEWQGLSPLGREMVAECNRLGIVVDASHASDAALAQMLELSTAPIVLSHSGCKAVTDHPRNVPDELLRTLAAKGGVIQMNAFSAYVTSLPIIPERNRALQALYASFGGWREIDSDAKRIAFLEARREIDRRYPAPVATFDEFMAHVLHALRVAGVDHVGFSGDFDGGGGVADLMDVTGAPRITARLLAEGYTEADLAKFWGGNVLRVLRAAEERAAVR
ncbi:MAG: membrane dipeptidase [Verrucomicrobia bacterium]|nr:membrane dipeptidase [Verrucomicrobiota bacterium]